MSADKCWVDMRLLTNVACCSCMVQVELNVMLAIIMHQSKREKEIKEEERRIRMALIMTQRHALPPHVTNNNNGRVVNAWSPNHSLSTSPFP